MLGELPLLGVPEELGVGRLAGKTTGGIAKHIRDHLGGVADPAVTAFLVAGAEHLEAVAPLRNSVLHARPATVDGRQVLYRWRAGGSPEAFAVTLDELRDRVADVERRTRELTTVRPPRNA